jgi:hypothetical protein
MDRQLVWVKKERFQGWECSACHWEFRGSGAIVGNTIEEMQRDYERQRDEEFRAHVCAQHPKQRPKNA